MSDRFWTDARVREALGVGGEAEDVAFHGVSTDTRAIEPGDLFVALVGERFDGHRFLDAAAQAGALGAVISDSSVSPPAGLGVYRVDDTLAALARLADYRRSRLDARFVGVVGSNGKTTTKELIRAALSTRFRTHATHGNLNNQIGVPLTLLRLPDDVEVAVIEMGTNQPGEIAVLTSIVRPDVAVVTSIGEEHLELLGDLEGVLREELSVVEGLAAGGKLFVAEEPETLPRRVRELVGRGRVRVAGFREGADLRPDGGERGIRTLEDGSTLWRWRGVEVRLPIPGRFNVRNALLALGVALDFGVPAQEAARNLATVSLPKLRGQWLRYGDLRVLADCYNANPPSVAAALDLLASLPARGRRVAVLGSMRELGSSSAKLHEDIADRAVKMMGDGLDVVVATGEFAPAFERHRAALGDDLVIASDAIEAYEAAAPSLRSTDTILLKASRGDELERWLPLLESRFGGGE